MIQSLLTNFDSFWLILSQVPGALQAAINIYERNPALAVFAFVGVFLGCVAKQLVGGGDDFETYCGGAEAVLLRGRYAVMKEAARARRR